MAFVVRRQHHNHQTRVGIEPTGFIELDLLAVIELTAKNAKNTKKDSYEWIA
jgi:hypothetical protein